MSKARLTNKYVLDRKQLLLRRGRRVINKLQHRPGVRRRGVSGKLLGGKYGSVRLCGRINNGNFRGAGGKRK